MENLIAPPKNETQVAQQQEVMASAMTCGGMEPPLPAKYTLSVPSPLQTLLGLAPVDAVTQAHSSTLPPFLVCLCLPRCKPSVKHTPCAKLRPLIQETNEGGKSAEVTAWGHPCWKMHLGKWW